MPTKNNTNRKKAKVGRPPTGKRVVPKTITLEHSDLDALASLATRAQTYYIMLEGKQNPNIGSSWVIRALIRNAHRAMDSYNIGDDHPAPAEFFGISGDVEATELLQD